MSFYPKLKPDDRGNRSNSLRDQLERNVHLPEYKEMMIDMLKEQMKAVQGRGMSHEEEALAMEMLQHNIDRINEM